MPAAAAAAAADVTDDDDGHDDDGHPVDMATPRTTSITRKCDFR